MQPKRDWVKEVMLPILGYAAVVGLVFGIWFRCQFAVPGGDWWPNLAGILVDGAFIGGLVCLLPTWAVLWVIWLIRQLRG